MNPTNETEVTHGAARSLPAGAGGVGGLHDASDKATIGAAGVTPSAGFGPGGAIFRTAHILIDDESCVGSWGIICSDCPLAPHLAALGMNLRECAAGIQTRVQGFVPLKYCEHYLKDSLRSRTDPKRLEIGCNKEAH